ncbi:hypothetical protein N0V88_006183 [Collariella sp. IMI 366227]|nr:hypothetical protein N0V88_006183 [Collariella sp. IMI 366227]
MLSLHDLPLEILNHIISAICLCCQHGLDQRCSGCLCFRCKKGSSDLKAVAHLKRLCQISTRLNLIATPHLYHRPACQDWWLLARTLIERPDLASHVKHLNIDYWHYVSDHLSNPLFSSLLAEHFSDSGLARAFEAVAHGNSNSVWWENEGTESMDMVISLCPGLETLDASPVTGPGLFSFRAPPGSLPRLNRLTIGHHPREIGLNFVQLRLIASTAPRLTVLSCHHVYQPVLDPTTPPFIFTHLAELCLSKSVLSLAALTTLLTACPHLQSFSYAAREFPQQHRLRFTPREAQNALIQHCPNLRSLSLYLCHGLTNNSLMPPASSLLTSFTPFANSPTSASTIRSLRMVSGSWYLDGTVLVPALVRLAEVAGSSFPGWRRWWCTR